MKIELSNGFAEIKDFVSRKVQREYQEALMTDSTIGLDGKIQASPIKMFLASDVLVKMMTESVTVDDKEIPLSKIDDIDSKDYTKILDACTTLMNSINDESKKK